MKKESWKNVEKHFLIQKMQNEFTEESRNNRNTSDD